MTAQISDSFFYRDEEFDLAGINGDGFFEPGDHGLAPVSWCTACWRGYVACFEVRDMRLVLDQLVVCLTDPREFHDGNPVKVLPPPVNGVAATLFPDEGMFNFEYQYQDLDYTVPFTGGLLLAKDFLADLYVHMGFHPAWKYRTVHELIFRKGRLVEERDVSATLAEVRERMKDLPREGDADNPPRGTLAWIEKCFSLDYRI